FGSLKLTLKLTAMAVPSLGGLCPGLPARALIVLRGDYRPIFTRHRRGSARFYSRGPDDLAPLLDFALHVAPELLWRAADGIRAFLRQALAGVGVLHDRGSLGAQLRHDFGRRAGRGDDAVP